MKYMRISSSINSTNGFCRGCLATATMEIIFSDRSISLPLQFARCIKGPTKYLEKFLRTRL